MKAIANERDGTKKKKTMVLTYVWLTEFEEKLTCQLLSIARSLSKLAGTQQLIIRLHETRGKSPFFPFWFDFWKRCLISVFFFYTFSLSSIYLSFFFGWNIYHSVIIPCRITFINFCVVEFFFVFFSEVFFLVFCFVWETFFLVEEHANEMWTADGMMSVERAEPEGCVQPEKTKIIFPLLDFWIISARIIPTPLIIDELST